MMGRNQVDYAISPIFALLQGVMYALAAGPLTVATVRKGLVMSHASVVHLRRRKRLEAQRGVDKDCTH
ncbi:hypothetical protein CBOM_07616 [Ceraceosorus bombacis]|uniref:Uncharacterized protein n=1 Tax=Ceraceosorus bombacis TaxID=401625 RepID=A0A0P1BGH7_9BASI|nr:hypothetical protein CBOM_07616 [Ceraceosorus bombacis]